MRKKKRKIGWYCPFSYFPLVKMEGVEPVKLSWESSGNGNYGSIKLCKKMTSVQKIISKRFLDGLIMADCCEISDAVYNQIEGESTLFPVYQMKIPLKYSSSFQGILYREWDNLTERLARERGNYSLSSGDYAAEKNGIENRWCSLPAETLDSLQACGRVEAALLLVREVFCPKIYYGQSHHDPKSDYNDAGVYMKIEDMECLAQSYWAMYAKELILGSKRDE